MYCSSEDCKITVETGKYRVILAKPPFNSTLLCRKSGRLFAFVAGGDCLKEDSAETISLSSEWEIAEKKEDSLLCIREEKSSSWERKQFVIRFEENAISCYHLLTGSGDIDEIRFFRECIDGREYGFGGNFDEVCTAAPNFREQRWFHSCSQVRISYGNDISLCTGIHALASVPHVLGLHDRRDETLLGAGFFASPGEYLWDDILWNPPVRLSPTGYAGDDAMAGGFAVNYYGKKRINGVWRSPELVFTFPETCGEMLSEALEYAYEKALLPRPMKKELPSWWYSPIYCTWDDQTSMNFKGEVDYLRMTGENPGRFCTEELTQRWLDILAGKGIEPGIVILDDKWQKSKVSAEPDTAKWPDLRRWIDQCHQRGLKVFLWNLAWHNEDIPAAEAITRNGEIVAGDVTSPAYEKRLRQMIHTYFSDEPGCLNADGMKLDGLLALPVGRGLHNHGNIWGLELQKRYLQIICDEAKKAKKDVCISTFAANPYLDEFTDMVRLGDMFTSRLTTEDSLLWRAEVLRTTHPYKPLDTDSQLIYNTDPDYLDIMDVQESVGIPTLYNAEYIRRRRPFLHPEYRKMNDDEYRKAAGVFARYRAKGKASAGVEK
ncbi:MAG: hypothetical protein IKD23_09195 [Lentisphaeria bacterium]|nr:hypothetical protein [Lentisphaeria bacterium]